VPLPGGRTGSNGRALDLSDAALLADPPPDLPDGLTPLHFACLYGRADVASALLGREGSVAAEALCAAGSAPLHEAAWSDRGAAVVRAVVDAAPSALRQRDRFGRTPLVCAALAGAAESVAALLAAAPDPTVEASHPGHRRPSSSDVCRRLRSAGVPGPVVDSSLLREGADAGWGAAAGGSPLHALAWSVGRRGRPGGWPGVVSSASQDEGCRWRRAARALVAASAPDEGGPLLSLDAAGRTPLEALVAGEDAGRVRPDLAGVVAGLVPVLAPPAGGGSEGEPSAGDEARRRAWDRRGDVPPGGAVEAALVRLVVDLPPGAADGPDDGAAPSGPPGAADDGRAGDGVDDDDDGGGGEDYDYGDEGSGGTG